jgi:hypothetical protein
MRTFAVGSHAIFRPRIIFPVAFGLGAALLLFLLLRGSTA